MEKQIKRSALLFLLIIIAGEVQLSYSQIKLPAATVPSANSMNLGLYGEMPVSMFSGLPDVSVPVYTIKTNTFSVPINLSYHASGVKPDVHPSWVGLGWSLSAGGSIDRVFRGKLDECNTTYHQLQGYYFDHARNTRSDWADNSYLSDFRWNDQFYDYNPDEFSFSFPGHSGKFFLDDAGNWRVQCDKPVKVKFDNEFLTPFPVNVLSGYSEYCPKPFKKFTLIDEFGIQYIFGESESAIEYSDEITKESGTWFIANSWKLKRIISADGADVIEFNYERGPYQSYLYNSLIQRKLVAYSYPGWPGFPGCTLQDVNFSYGGKITSPVYLKSIEYPRQSLKIEFTTSGSIELSYDHQLYDDVIGESWNNDFEDSYFSNLLNLNLQIPFWNPGNPLPELKEDRFRWLELNSINITNSQTHTSIRSVTFNYNNISTERLKLLSADFKDATSANIQSYTFTYNNDPLPGYMQSRGDHWGFNNGSPALINASPTTIAGYFSSRTPDFGYAKRGILEQITYPTGGKTILEYELHNYAKVVNSQNRTVCDNVSGDAGGLRVKKIRTIDNAGHEQVNEYFYVTGYTAGANPATLTSSGVLDALPQYQFNFAGVDDANWAFTMQIYSANPLIPLSLTSTGQHIGYTEVVEKRSDGAYTISKFTNHDNGYADLNAVNNFNRNTVPFVPPNSRDFERGRNLSKFVYDKNGKLIKSEEYEFERIGNITQQAARCIDQGYTHLCDESFARQFVSRTAFYYYYYPFVVKKLTTKTYESGTNTNYVTSIQDFTYQNRLVKTIISTDSKQQQVKTENYYPENFTAISVYNTMFLKNMLDFPIQIDQSRNTILKKSTKIEYKQWANGGIYPEFVKEQIENNPIETNLQINDYDSRGNIISETPKNGVKESFVWSYNQLLLVARVTNADVTDIAYSSFEMNGNTSWNFTGIPVADYNAPMGRKAYSLTNGGISRTGLDPARTYTVSYWSKNGAQNVEGVAATTGRTINGYTYYEHHVINPPGGTITVSGSGIIDELRLYPQGAFMTTYTYEPVIGMSAQCDDNNRISYFEYDAFARLMLIRDQDKNILKKICYNYDGHTENCNVTYYYNNTPKSGTFTPICPPGRIPTPSTPVTYTVPANVYVSTISVEAANQLAQADVDAYGQAYANSLSVCHQNITVQFEFDLVSWYDDGYTFIENWDCWLRFYDPGYLWETVEIDAPLNIHYTITSTYGGTEHFYITAPAFTREYYLGYFSEAIYMDPYYYNSLQFIVVSAWW